MCVVPLWRMLASLIARLKKDAPINKLSGLLLLLSFTGALAYGDGKSGTPPVEASRQYTYAWQFLPGAQMAPRGGTTVGTQVTLETQPSEQWLALQDPGLSAQERDRRAILAMAGPYRTSFDFIETVGFTEGYRPESPYQSWGTEFVYVVANEPEFVSLQHIMVMRMLTPEGEELPAHVVKHWRQDWRYEQRDLHTYRGDQTWARERLSRGTVNGRWVQSVYQVDDSLRYTAVGDWEHTANYSSWTSVETWRPLPRREFSVRDDYDVLIGTNRHTLTPTGWVQEEHNLKVALNADGQTERVLARENGLARYERIEAFDWSPGDEYWQRTGAFWAQVRKVWSELLAENTRLQVDKSVDGTPLFVAMFELAELRSNADFDAAQVAQELRQVLGRYIAR